MKSVQYFSNRMKPGHRTHTHTAGICTVNTFSVLLYSKYLLLPPLVWLLVSQLVSRPSWRPGHPAPATSGARAEDSCAPGELASCSCSSASLELEPTSAPVSTLAADGATVSVSADCCSLDMEQLEIQTLHTGLDTGH